jgi:hypothetical protein
MDGHERYRSRVLICGRMIIQDLKKEETVGIAGKHQR